MKKTKKPFTLEGCTVLDLDGCLSDDRRRRPLLTSGYDAYHADLINDPVANVNAVVCAQLNGAVVFSTARPEKYRVPTQKWIEKSFPFLMGQYALFMRAEGDERGSVELKTAVIGVIGVKNIIKAHDDRADVVAAYRDMNIDATVLKLPMDAADILMEMGATYIERNTVYQDGYRRVAPVIRSLWPEGVPAGLVTEDRWHLFELLVVKLTRFATSGLTHEDSIHDAAVYAAMIESDLRRKN